MRIGYGYDVHPLVEGRRLILGGIEVPFPKGLQGRSDADVLLHAIADALLGAIGAGDLGSHFPESAAWTEGLSSQKILDDVRQMVTGRGYRIENIDAMIIAEFPPLRPYFPRMIERIAGILDIPCERVNLKATTHEGLGPLGRGEGMAAHAVACLKRNDLHP